MSDNINDLKRRYESCIRTSKDKGTTPAERDTAKRMAATLKKKIRIAGHDFLDKPEYKDAVKRGLILVKDLDQHQWELGDLAHQKVEKKDYGAGALETFADDIGVEFSTLRSYMATALAWPKNVSRLTFSICRSLNSHPNRAKIITDTMTKREAMAEMKKFREQQRTKEDKKKAEDKKKKKDATDLPSLVKQFVQVLEHFPDAQLVRCMERVSQMGDIGDLYRGRLNVAMRDAITRLERAAGWNSVVPLSQKRS